VSDVPASITAEVEAFHATRSQALFGFARRCGLGDEAATDAVQEAMLRLWRELGAGRRIEDFDAWSFRVVYRLAMDEHRAARRVRALAERLLPFQRAGTRQRDATDRIAVWAEVDRLPRRQREVLYLRYRADLTFDQIGEAIGVSSGACRSHASRGLETIRQRLAAGSDER
jgi:RNA polymerase sigma factor (sigma-70 family)